MENRKSIISFSLFLSLAVFSQAFAYEIGTHEFLTSEILNFYSQNFPEKSVPEEFKKFVIEGSNHEDDIYRWFNHFYDPVYNRGLTAVPGDWVSSKEWARSKRRQISALYNPLLNTTIAGLLAITNPAELEKTDFTWERAINDYVKGDKKRAFRALGQILHLIEDVSVPDHTRNDPHPAFNHEDSLETGSPYELWASNFNLDNPDKNLSSRLLNKNPIILADLNAYFDEMAEYSNNNFYSKDTIGIGEYKSPEPDYFGLGPSGKTYGFKKDNEFGDYYLVRASGLLAWNVIVDDDGLLKNKYILNDYWSRLSVKAVQHGAGVIDLFFKEVEKAKNDPSFVREEPKSMLAQVVKTVGDFFNQFLRKEADTSGLALVAEIPLKKNSDVSLDQSREIRPPEVISNTQFGEVGSPIGNRDEQNEDEAERIANQQQTIPTPAGVGTPTGSVGATNNSAASVSGGGAGQGEVTFQPCKYGTGGTPTHQKLLINEVAWMGGTASANDEWLELKNVSGGELNISGWQILDKSEQIKITFPSGTKLGADSLMLLERTDDNSVPSVVADLIYTGALSNTDEGLRLFDKNCVLADEVKADPSWPAGDSAARKTMERVLDLGWHTSLEVGGTPKKENTQLAADTTNQSNMSDPFNTSDQSNSSSTEQVNHLVISEVQITGGSGATTNDFIELYNPTGEAINLNGYRLVKRTKTGTSDTSIKSWTSDTFVPAKGFYLWANSNYTSIGVVPDVTTTASIADDNGVALRQGATDTGTIIDSVSWGEAQNVFAESAVFATNPGANQSLERKAYSNGCVTASGNSEYLGNGCDTNSNSNDFELRSTVKPQNSQSFPEPRQSPAQAKNLNVSYSSSALELVLNWGQSQDYNGATSSVKYLISHSTSTLDNLKNITELTDATSYQFKINDLGATHYLGVTVKDAEGLSATTTTANTAIGTPLSNLYFYKDTRSVTSQKYLLDFYYQNYPFVPEIYRDNARDSWKILVFYLNQEVPEELELNTSNNWQPGNLNGVLEIKYPNCTGGNTAHYSLILPDLESRCSNGGGVENSALQWSELEDQHLLFELATTSDEVTFTENDFVAVGMYSFYQSGGGDQKFKLTALDRTKYYFSTTTPSHQPPIFNGNLELNFDQDQSKLNVSWQKASDSDTLETLITYEINYSTTTELADWRWQDNGSSITANKAVSAGDQFLIGVRVKDDFGNYSFIATTSWFYPPTTFYINQIEANDWSASFGTKNPNCPFCPDTANLQSIQPEEDFEFNTVVLRLKQGEVSDVAEVQLSVYPDNAGFPDFDSFLAVATLKNLLNPDPNSDIAFIFNEPVLLISGEIYWLVLDVKNYSSGNTGFYRNQWQNAVDTSNDSYADGWAGKGAAGVCGDYCDFTIPYPNAMADWYMKIGLAP